MDGKEWQGKVIDGRYVVEAVLGQGGMGLVLRARHKFTGALVAVKMLHGHLRLRGDLADRFLAEARAPATIGHPGIVAVTDAGTTPEGDLYLVMELLQGLPLRDIVARGRLPLGAVRRIGLDLLAALAAAHAAGFVHRDLKPENLFVTNGGNVKLLDFGIAKVLTEDVAGKGHTAVGSVLGTLWYMAPEQLNDSRSVDLRADLWAVGVIIYELLAGILPYQADTVVRMMAMMMTQDPDPITRHIPGAPPALTGFMTRALAREPAWRFQSAAEMATALVALPLGPEGDLHPALLVNPNATPPPLHGVPTPPPLPMHGGPTPPPFANPYAGNTPSPLMNPYGGQTPPPSVYPFPAVNPPPYPTNYPNANLSQVPGAPPLASAPAPVVVPKTVATAGRPARWPYILGALGLSAGIAVGIVALAGPSPKTEEEPAKRVEPAPVPKTDVLAELHQKQDPPPPLPAPPPPDPAPTPPSKPPATHTTPKKPPPPKPAPQPVVTPPPPAPTPAPQPEPTPPPPAPTPQPVQPQPPPPQPSPPPQLGPPRPGDYRTDAQACADGCRMLARCGMYADRNCEAGCMASPITVACAHRANDCNTAGSCVLASVCSGAMPRGYASCSATAQCEASCGNNLACGCRCIQNLSLRHTAALVVLNQCAVSCAGNMQCLQQKCANAINRCSRE